MNCINCNNPLQNGVYYCSTNDYSVINNIEEKLLIFIFKTHDLEEGDEELEYNESVKYCNNNECKYITFDIE